MITANWRNTVSNVYLRSNKSEDKQAWELFLSDMFSTYTCYQAGKFLSTAAHFCDIAIHARVWLVTITSNHKYA